MTSFQSLDCGQLVVGVDRVGALRAVDIALGAVDRGDRDLAAHVLQRQALGDELRRIDLDADRGLLLAADEDLRDAGDLADLLGELGVDGVADGGQRQRVGRRRQQQDRRVGRVDLAVGRRRGQVLRQLAAGGVDRALHVVGGAVDVAVEVELDGDRRRCPDSWSRSSGRCRGSGRTAAPAAAPPTRPWSPGCRPADWP